MSQIILILHPLVILAPTPPRRAVPRYLSEMNQQPCSPGTIHLNTAIKAVSPPVPDFSWKFVTPGINMNGLRGGIYTSHPPCSPVYLFFIACYVTSRVNYSCLSKQRDISSTIERATNVGH